MIYGCRTLAYRASHNIFVLNCSRAQLSSTCNTLQINTISSGFLHTYTRKVLLPHSKHYNQHPIYFPLYNYTLISLRFMPILGEHTESYMIYTSEQRRLVSIIINIRYISRCVIQISSQSGLMLHALLLGYIYTSEHIKNLQPTALWTDARARCRHWRSPLNIHELPWRRVSRHAWEWPRKPHRHHYLAPTVHTQQMSHMYEY